MTDRKQQQQPQPAVPVWQRNQARQPARPTRTGWGAPKQGRTTFGGRGHR
jgi:hypothetical protein